MIPTFGRINWDHYYRRKQPPLNPLADRPCLDCGRAGTCVSTFSPKNRCSRYTAWLKKWWPIVTGKAVR